MSQQNLGNRPLLPFLRKTYASIDPFVWIHVALLAAVPLTLVLSMIGLAVGDPVFPGWLETLLLGLPPIGLTVWLQWQKPLSLFSLWVVHKPSESLNEDQRRILTILKSYVTGWVAVVAGVFIYVIFRQMFITAPLAAGIIPFPSILRLVGVLWSVVFLLISSLLWQTGVAALRILLVSETEFANTVPYEIDRIKAGFTILGNRSTKLLEFTAPKTTAKTSLKTSPKTARKAAPSAPVSSPDPDSIESIPEPISELIPEPISDLAQNPPLEKSEEPSSELLEEFQEQLDKTIMLMPELTEEVEEFSVDLTPESEPNLESIENLEVAQSELAEVSIETPTDLSSEVDSNQENTASDAD